MLQAKEKKSRKGIGGAKPGEQRRLGVPNKVNPERQRIRDILQKLDFDPIECLCHFAMGNVIALKLMTQKELDAPARAVRVGNQVIVHKSGFDKSLELIPAKLRADCASDVATYAYPKRAAVAMVDDDGNAVKSRVILYAPSNGRGDAQPSTT
jgi:hypothetical protein